MTSKMQRSPKRDGRDRKAFTPVFDGLCPDMTLSVSQSPFARLRPSATQLPQHLVQLIEIAVLDVQRAALAAVIDGDFQSERI